jgi:aldehyde dehydrogenase (NAD+)
MADEQDWGNLIAGQKAAAAACSDNFKERRQRLCRLKDILIKRESDFLAALASDLGKSGVEAYASEIAVVLNEIEYLKRHLHSVLRRKRIVGKPGQRISVSHLPYGSVLILSPWNYPLQLALSPLAGALAAGNSCILKPSEFAPATGNLLASVLAEAFQPEIVKVIQGDGQTAASLLKQEFDFIFFTGSERVGRKVAKAAAELLIPCILELGGKCPCVVDSASVNEITARRIVWGKFFNAGQTCIAPDYILVAEQKADQLIDLIISQIRSLFGRNITQSPDFGRIISDSHLQRLIGYLDQGRICFGGHHLDEQRYLEPTVLTDIPAGSSILSEEIFGPVLPILTFSETDKLIEHLRLQPEPLTVYGFCRDEDLIMRLNAEIRSGAFCLNQVLQHAASSEFPFGGVGSSGYGRYHGKASLLAFSYEKLIYKSMLWPDFRSKYPPYGKIHLDAIRKLRRLLP